MYTLPGCLCIYFQAIYNTPYVWVDFKIHEEIIGNNIEVSFDAFENI
jgi:hypothetical protein